MAALVLWCYMWAFSSCGEWGLLSSCSAWASHCSGFSCCRAQALGWAGFSSCGYQALEHRLSSCGAWFPCSMWDLPGARIEPTSPELAGGFLTTGPPEKFLKLGFDIVSSFLAEKAVAPHSSTLAWKIPWTEEPGRLQSMGSLGVGHDWATSLSLFTFLHWRRKWQPTPVFLPGESQGQGSLLGCHLWGRTESDTTEVT